MENNTEHFSAGVVAHWCARSIDWENWSLSMSRGENVAEGRGLALLLPQTLRAIWELQMNTGEWNILADPLRTLRVNQLTQGLNLKRNWW